MMLHRNYVTQILVDPVKKHTLNMNVYIRDDHMFDQKEAKT